LSALLVDFRFIAGKEALNLGVKFTDPFFGGQESGKAKATVMDPKSGTVSGR
jgi:hypothetical protein